MKKDAASVNMGDSIGNYQDSCDIAAMKEVLLHLIREERGQMRTDYKYLLFTPTPSTGKTSRWECKNKNSLAVLGVIKWHCGWRQYCYFPSCPAVYSAGCLDDISDFIKQL